MSRQENDKHVVYAEPTAPQVTNNSLPIATIATAQPVERLYTRAEVTAAVLAALQVSSLRKGDCGWVHFLFQTEKQAHDFVSSNRLHAEGKDCSRLKGIDPKRHVGAFTVRVSPGLYAAIQDKHRSLPKHGDIEPAVSFRRGR